MSTALTVAVDEVNGRLSVSRALFLGSEYLLTFTGLSEGASPTLALYDCEGNVLALSDPIAGTLKLNTPELVAAFEGSTKSRAIHFYLYEDSAVLATGPIPVAYSPLEFTLTTDPNLGSVGIGLLFPDGVRRVMKPTIVGGQPTHYWEEVT